MGCGPLDPAVVQSARRYRSPGAGEDLSPPGRQPEEVSNPRRASSHQGRTSAPRAPGGDAMATDNTVTLIGNLTDDPELRFTANGGAVATFRLAVTPRIRQGDTWTDGETSFFRITCWRQLAEHGTETLSKAARAIVIGRLRLRSWETDQSERRSLVEVEADEVAPSLKFGAGVAGVDPGAAAGRSDGSRVA